MSVEAFLAYAGARAREDEERALWRAYVADSVRASARGEYVERPYTAVLGDFDPRERPSEGFGEIARRVVDGAKLKVV